MPLVGLEPTRPKAPRPQRDTSTIPSQGLFLERSYREEGKNKFFLLRSYFSSFLEFYYQLDLVTPGSKHS